MPHENDLRESNGWVMWNMGTFNDPWKNMIIAWRESVRIDPYAAPNELAPVWSPGHIRFSVVFGTIQQRYLHKWTMEILPIGSMYAIYGNMDTINIPPLC